MKCIAIIVFLALVIFQLAIAVAVQPAPDGIETESAVQPITSEADETDTFTQQIIDAIQSFLPNTEVLTKMLPKMK